MARKTKPATLILFAVILVVAWYFENRKTEESPTTSGPATREHTDTSDESASPAGAIERAFREKRSKVWVEDEGRIVHLLPDDRIAPRHQLCLVELASGHTIKISHNVDLAPKVPWKKGQTLSFRGRFEFNDKGGVVHWTHHDPGGRKQGGWLRYAGKTYK